ncbi:MAG: GNAT family N-acetyltransferase [Marivita sp.]|uniref:GNAT family N-acetyltransferase n=1 Tax=Marivita sp. TaxID=2003365 RepID=UPI0025BC6D24|nr:GNAT family protein [Marivita sp.]MCI5112004.1 GNAT family N-acetyltransferase [Marivita sp.]
MSDPLITGQCLNALAQRVGLPLADTSPRPVPPRSDMVGRYCSVVPLSPDHADDLYTAFRADEEDRIWTYLPNGPYHDPADFNAWVEEAVTWTDPLMHAIVVKDRAVGHASYLRINPTSASIEVGFINLSPALQRTRAATEFQFLMMQRAFDELGYRRYEWKCDALNAPSRRAAERLGFTYEGTFRQATHYKGRNRDTAWFSIIDTEWPDLKARFLRWLAPDNFDAEGVQKTRLPDI